MEVICETREDWWNALLAWLRSLGGSKGICHFLKPLLDSTNYLIHLVHCNFSSTPDSSECSHTFMANQLAWFKEQDVANTEKLNFASGFLLAVVVIIVHLILSALILALLLPFIAYLGVFNSKVEEVLARTLSTRRTTSTRRATSAGKRSRTASKRRSRKATPAKRTRSKPAKCISFDNKLPIFFGAQVRYQLTSTCSSIETEFYTGCWLRQP